ncbi:MAG: LptF/LptG family permease [Endomicrobia bacterium]|nr:LptF/LptG family permease [Endomicrobiia bacterium]MDW8055553.1 LptF/LptG family permease [Elusimicrobiota bacterium]
MTTLKKYLIIEFFKHFIPIEFLFITIFALSEFFWQIGDFITYKTPFLNIIYYLTLLVPLWTTQTLPLSIMLSTLLVVTNFVFTREIISIQTLGVNLRRFFSILLIAGIFLSISSFALHDKVATKLFNNAYTFFHEKIKNEQVDTDVLKSLSYVSYINGYSYVFIEKYDRKLKKCYSFLLEQYDSSNRNMIQQLYSPEGEKINSALKLKNCVIRQFSGPTIISEKLYNEYLYKLPIDIEEFRYDFSSMPLDKLNIAELKHAIQILTYKGESTYRIIAEISFRYAISSLNFIIMLVSISLGKTTSSQYGKLTSFVYTIIALIVYWTSLSFCRTFGELNIINPMVSVWIPNIVFFIFGTILYFRRYVLN